MVEEILGPVITIYVYDENKFNETLTLLDETSEYALTGSIISQDRYAINHALRKLENAAGNFYINDKPTGAVVGQQPDRKSTRLNSSHVRISYAVFCLKKKKLK